MEIFIFFFNKIKLKKKKKKKKKLGDDGSPKIAKGLV